MEDRDYTKPMMFRPSTKDAEAFRLIAEKNPVMSATAADLIRIALQDYVFNHGEDSTRSKTARLNAHEALLVRICQRLNVPYEDVLIR